MWLMVVAGVSAALILRFSPLELILPRLAIPRVTLECVGTLLTAVTAVWAAFELSIPDRSPRWMWLPAAPFALWLGASGLGCLQNGLSLHGPGGIAGHSPHCFIFISAVSVPLAAALFWMLRRARPIHAWPVAAMGTLGVAATAALVLQFFHPFDVTVIDLALHLAAVAPGRRSGHGLASRVARRQRRLSADPRGASSDCRQFRWRWRWLRRRRCTARRRRGAACDDAARAPA